MITILIITNPIADFSSRRLGSAVEF